MKYLEFTFFVKKRIKDNLCRKIIKRVLKIFLPISNPDFEDKLEDVKYWLLEFDDEGFPIREIGVDVNDEVIVKMPYKKNYGFWIDNELKYTDFIEMFLAKEVDQKFFKEKWNNFP